VQVKLLREHGEKSFALIFDKDDAFAAAMQAFAAEHQLDAASFTAIGAFSAVTLGYFDRATLDYKQIQIDEQVEVLSLIGNIALDSEHRKPKLHAHVVLGKADGTAHGGHLMEARIWPTLEVIVTESPAHLRRVSDPETGLALIQL
jgi:predicted DNA-binding protein with PD1-like motif